MRQVGSSGGSMLGVAVDGRGRVYACDAGRGEIARWDPTTGAVSTYARGVDGGDMDCPNVAAFGPDGSLYVTCSGEDDRPEIVRISPGGEHVERWTDAAPGYPNGALVTPDGAALVVVEAHEQRVVRVPILADGSAGSPSLVAALPDTDPDGIALAADGAYWVTLYRPEGSSADRSGRRGRGRRRRPPRVDVRRADEHRMGGGGPRPRRDRERRRHVPVDRRSRGRRHAAAPAGVRLMSGDTATIGPAPRRAPRSFVVVFQLRIVMCWYMGIATTRESRLWVARLVSRGEVEHAATRARRVHALLRRHVAQRDRGRQRRLQEDHLVAVPLRDRRRSPAVRASTTDRIWLALRRTTLAS